MAKIGIVQIIDDVIQDAPAILIDEKAIEADVATFNAIPAPKPPSAFFNLIAAILTQASPLADTVASQVAPPAPAPAPKA